ncbi:MAG TPA: DUF5683 domain-containing protein [Saprospiraceae bacterium]|nr:DUF5683 domain-containing protein [Saprospiraceae bacterium]
MNLIGSWIFYRKKSNPVLFLLRYILCIFLASVSVSSYAQDHDSVLLEPGIIVISDTIRSDTQKVITNSGADLRGPRQALVRSLILPGLGQAYNKRYWKIPIVYGALAGMTAVAIWNRNNYREFAGYYRNSIDGIPHPYDRYPAQSLKSIRDGYRQNMELSWIGVGAIYLLQALEAYVNAHLKTFNVSDDISLKIKPTLSSPGAPGIGLCLQFSGSSR